MKVVVLTGFGSIATAIEAIRAGARHYLTKPADVSDVIAAFDQRDGAPQPPLTVPSLERVEWEHIQRVLLSVGGNVTLAAKLLGIHRRGTGRRPTGPARACSAASGFCWWRTIPPTAWWPAPC